jgi:hypothetical protein
MNVAGAVGVESKPRDLRSDRGYRVVVVSVSVRLNLNPHPPEGWRVRHPRGIAAIGFQRGIYF